MEGNDDIEMMLVVEHKTKGRKLVEDGVAVLSEYEVMLILSENPDIRLCHKELEPKQTSFDIYKADLYEEGEKIAIAKKKGKGKKDGKIGEDVPWKYFLGHEYAEHSFSQVTILVPEDVAKPK